MQQALDLGVRANLRDRARADDNRNHFRHTRAEADRDARARLRVAQVLGPKAIEPVEEARVLFDGPLTAAPLLLAGARRAASPGGRCAALSPSYDRLGRVVAQLLLRAPRLLGRAQALHSHRLGFSFRVRGGGRPSREQTDLLLRPLLCVGGGDHEGKVVASGGVRMHGGVRTGVVGQGQTQRRCVPQRHGSKHLHVLPQSLQAYSGRLRLQQQRQVLRRRNSGSERWKRHSGRAVFADIAVIQDCTGHLSKRGVEMLVCPAGPARTRSRFGALRWRQPG